MIIKFLHQSIKNHNIKQSFFKNDLSLPKNIYHEYIRQTLFRKIINKISKGHKIRLHILMFPFNATSK